MKESGHILFCIRSERYFRLFRYSFKLKVYGDVHVFILDKTDGKITCYNFKYFNPSIIFGFPKKNVKNLI